MISREAKSARRRWEEQGEEEEEAKEVEVGGGGGGGGTKKIDHSFLRFRLGGKLKFVWLHGIIINISTWTLRIQKAT